MKYASLFCALLIGMSWPGLARGQAQSDAVAQVAPFVNNFTLGVVRVEPGGIDFDALQRWGEDVIKRGNMNAADAEAATEGLKQVVQASRQWTDQFTRAGGKSVWVIFTVENFPDDPFFVVLPLEKGADGQALKNLVTPKDRQGANSVVQSRGALILANSATAAERVRSIVPQPRPELAKALAESGDAKLRVALIPSDDARRVIESMVPKLPNGASSEVLTKGMLWASATITSPANVTFHGTIQSDSNSAAEAFRKLLGEFTPPARPAQGNHAEGPLPGLLVGEFAAHARVNGDRVLIDLNEDQTKTAATHLAVILRRVRTQAARVRSASNMRQILMGCFMYANDHKGEFPDTLDQALKAADIQNNRLLVTNPMHPDEVPGYAYIKPPEGVKAGSDRVVLYEKYKPTDEGINLGYADGHVEFWPRQTGEKQIEAAKARVK